MIKKIIFRHLWALFDSLFDPNNDFWFESAFNRHLQSLWIWRGFKEKQKLSDSFLKIKL